MMYEISHKWQKYYAKVKNATYSLVQMAYSLYRDRCIGCIDMYRLYRDVSIVCMYRLCIDVIERERALY
jgi:hypothetical protein